MESSGFSIDGRKILEGFKIAGAGIARAGRWTGRQVAANYRKLDPDVPRHIVQIPLLAYGLFAHRTNVVEPKSDDGYSPLIFVHGLGGMRGNFAPMSMWLSWQGRSRSYAVDFKGDQDANAMAETLTRFVEQVLAVNGEKKVDIVAHSLGGLVSRLAMADFGLSDKVGTFITLGSPHAGTCPARYAYTPVIRQLRSGSALVRKLNKESLPTGINAFSFWSRNDLMILPPESAMLEGSCQVDVSPFTHYSYLIDPRSWNLVGQLLIRHPEPLQIAAAQDS